MREEFSVPSEMTLLEALREHFPKSSGRKLREMLTEGRVTVVGKASHRAKQQVAAGASIEIHPRDKAAASVRRAERSLKTSRLAILHEDETLLVVDKPPNLLSVATDKMEPDTLHSRALGYLRSKGTEVWPFIVHRLDKKTSGVMVFAKDESAKQHLQTQFAQRSVERVYHCLVEGSPQEESGVVQNHLHEDKNLRVRSCEPRAKGAREAITEWTVESSREPFSLIRLLIGTGRRHQIRVHMSEMGFPIAGDRMHGAKSDPLQRLCLHASSLAFEHPRSGERVRFSSKYEVLRRLL